MSTENSINPILLRAGEGRRYRMGPLEAVFKADRAETQERFSISEWWLDARHEGPGAHKHDANEEVFYVLEGEPSILIGEVWHRMAKGAMCMIPRGTMHDFRNESHARMGLLNIFVPGPFEDMMPAIVGWFLERPPRPLD